MKKDLIEELRSSTQCDIIENPTGNCPNCGETPCFGTPQEILNLMEAGYTQYLDFGILRVGNSRSISDAIFIAIPEEIDGTCVFHANGTCRLHSQNLTLAQGRITCPSKLKKPKEYNPCPLILLPILQEWEKPDNQDIILKIKLLASLIKLKDLGDKLFS